MTEWIVAYRCSRCRAVLGTVDVDVSEEGSFEISDVPGKCNVADCQAGFSDLTGYTLQITFYRRSAP